MKKSFVRRLFSMLVAVMMVVGASVSAMAAEVTPEVLAPQEVSMSAEDEPMPIFNRAIAANSGNISGGYGEIKVNLGKNVSYGGLEAAVSSNNNSGTISVSVRSPSGGYTTIGGMAASGGSTGITPVHGLGSGTYTFIFVCSNTTATFNLQCYIFE